MELLRGSKKLIIQVTDNSIIILTGSKNKIQETNNIPLEAGVCVDGRILKLDIIIRKLNHYLDVNANNIKKVSFVVGGSDIIIRNVEVPILRDEALRQTINFELDQFIPNRDEYYTSYEIVGKINEKDKKVYKILLAAVGNDKITPIVEVAKGINRELEVIDILPNVLRTIMRNSKLLDENSSTAIFYIGSNSSTISIIEGNYLNFERNIPFGVKNILYESYDELVVKDEQITGKAFEEILDSDVKVKNSFDNLLSSINNTVRYYNSGRGNKPIQSFIVICSDILINSIEKHLERYLDIKCILIKNPIDLDLRISFEENFYRYIVLYGFLLRGNDNRLLNLNPSLTDNNLEKSTLDQKLTIITLAVLLILMVVSVPLYIVNAFIDKDIKNITIELDKYKEIIEKNDALKTLNGSMESFINKIDIIKNSTIKTSTILTDIDKYVPEYIELSNLSFVNTGTINIIGEAKTYHSIPEFLANLQMSDKFKNATISYINPIEKAIAVNSDNKQGTMEVGSKSVLNVNKVCRLNNEINKQKVFNRLAVKLSLNEGDGNGAISNSNASSSANGSNSSSKNSTNNTKKNTITVYSFSISIEGVDLNGTTRQ